jgi:hypothetical protein
MFSGRIEEAVSRVAEEAGNKTVKARALKKKPRTIANSLLHQHADIIYLSLQNSAITTLR